MIGRFHLGLGTTRRPHSHDAVLSFVLGLGLAGPASAQPLPDGSSGIAARYPGDAGIGSDSDVTFAGDFESYTSAADPTRSGTRHTTRKTRASRPNWTMCSAAGRRLNSRCPSRAPK